MSLIAIGIIEAVYLVLKFMCLNQYEDYPYLVLQFLRSLFRSIMILSYLFAILSSGLSWLDASTQIQVLRPLSVAHLISISKIVSFITRFWIISVSNTLFVISFVKVGCVNDLFRTCFVSFFTIILIFVVTFNL